MRVGIMLLVFFCCGVCYGQKNVGVLVPDSSFANNGISEIDFNGFADEMTAFDVLGGLIAPNRRILVAGKIKTAIPGEIQFGMVQYIPEGSLDQAFGTGGKKIISWDSVDYPTAITIYPTIFYPAADTLILAAGATSHTTAGNSLEPAIYKFKTDGSPDSSFGINGRVVMSFAEQISGICQNVRRIEVGYILACGNNISVLEHEKGFGALWLKRDGTPDSAYGINGRIVIPAPVSSAIGYFTSDLKVFFAGVSIETKPHLVFGKLTENGLIDSSFGTNGLLHTSIALADNLISASASLKGVTDNSGNVVLAVRLEHTPEVFTIVGIKTIDGSIDTTYGSGGFATSSTIAGLEAKGIVISNDGSSLIGCRANIGVGQCAATKFNLNGTFDTTFGTQGVALVDLYNGTKENYFVGFNSIGGKKFIGVGVAGSGTERNFLVTRFRQEVPTSVVSESRIENVLKVFPNPAKSSITIDNRHPSPSTSISVIDMMGREVYSSNMPSPYTLDVSTFSEGAYNCLLKNDIGVIFTRFIINR